MDKRVLFLALVLLCAALACTLPIQAVQPTATAAEVPTLKPAFTAAALTVTAAPAATKTRPAAATPTPAPAKPSVTPKKNTAVPPTQPPQAQQPPVQLFKEAEKPNPPQVSLVDALSGKLVKSFPTAGLDNYYNALAVDESLFYTNQDNTQVIKADFNGKEIELKFLNPGGEFFDGVFLPSPDGKKIAWGALNQVQTNQGSQVHYVLKIANVDGTAEKILLEKTVEIPERPMPLFWSADGEAFYFSLMPYGIGGYMLFGGGPDLRKVDLKTGKISDILPRHPGFAAMGLSPDESTLAYIIMGEKHSLYLRDVATGKEKTIRLPDPYLQGGSVYWAPDGKSLVLGLALGNPEKEAFRVVRVDAGTLAMTDVIQDDPRQLRPVLWPVQDMLWLNDGDNQAWRFEFSTGLLTQVPGGGVIRTDWR